MNKILKVFILALGLTQSLHALDPTFYKRVTMTATGATVTAAAVYMQSFAVEVQSVTGTVTLTVEGSQDGATWNRLVAVNTWNQTKSISITANGLYVGGCGGIRNVRVRAVVVTSGVADVGLGIGNGPPNTVTTAWFLDRARAAFYQLLAHAGHLGAGDRTHPAC